jgi:hypothetical protein
MWRALWLSQNKTGSLQHSIYRSFNKYCSHINSQVAADKALYSASDEDLEIVDCFLAFHEISDEPRKKQ